MIHSLTLAEEHTLMLQTAAGDEMATRKLTADYLDYVISLAFKVVGNRYDAEEIAQDVFLKLFKQAEKWEPKARVSTWLYRVTYNAAIDCLRSKKRHFTLELKESMTKKEIEEINFLSEDIESLEIAMGHLPQHYRIALTLFYYQEKKTKEAAMIMSLKEDAFESLLRRARKKLKTIIEESVTPKKSFQNKHPLIIQIS